MAPNMLRDSLISRRKITLLPRFLSFRNVIHRTTIAWKFYFTENISFFRFPSFSFSTRYYFLLEITRIRLICKISNYYNIESIMGNERSRNLDRFDFSNTRYDIFITKKKKNEKCRYKGYFRHRQGHRRSGPGAYTSNRSHHFRHVTLLLAFLYTSICHFCACQMYTTPKDRCCNGAIYLSEINNRIVVYTLGEIQYAIK